MKNQECKIRPEIININSDNPIFYRFSIKINKCRGNFNNINNPYAKICLPDIVKNLNIKVFNLMSLTNETRFIKRHEKCKCECILDAIACNNKQQWNKNKYRCEWKELIDKGICDKGFIRNPSNCECEWDKNCDISEYLDYENYKCRKIIFDKFVEECTENINKKIAKIVKIAEISLFKNKNNYEYNSCKVYIALMIKVFTIFTGITIYLVYYNWSLINNNNNNIYCIKFSTHKKTQKFDGCKYINGNNEANKY